METKILSSLWWATAKPPPFCVCSGPDTGAEMNLFLNIWEFTELGLPRWLLNNELLVSGEIKGSWDFPTSSATGSRYKKGKCPKGLSTFLNVGWWILYYWADTLEFRYLFGLVGVLVGCWFGWVGLGLVWFGLIWFGFSPEKNPPLAIFPHIFVLRCGNRLTVQQI